MSSSINKQDLEAMSSFRYELRKFLRVSEEVCNAAGITTLQYQLLLHVRGFPERRWATVGELAERYEAEASALELTFTLPPGSYATVLVEELFPELRGAPPEP